MRRAIYPGSFDPPTRGHIDLIRRARKIFDEVTVAVAHESGKTPLFTVEERLGFLKRAVRGMRGVSVASFEGLAVDFARSRKAQVIIRGVRMVTDFEYEFQMALTNRKLSPDLETVFMMPSESYSYFSSRLIKEAAALGGRVGDFVPPYVEQALRRKFK